MSLKNYEIDHDRDEQYYIIDTDTGESYSFDAIYDVTKPSVSATHESPSEAAEYDVTIDNIELFDAEGMRVGTINPKLKIAKEIKSIMDIHFADDANDYQDDNPKFER